MKIGIWGICGKMGRMLCDTIKETDGYDVAFGVDSSAKQIENVATYEDSECIKTSPDVIIDFSNRSSTSQLLSLALRLKTPLIICSTGQNTEDLKKIYLASREIPILLTPNTSMGAAYLTNSAIKGAKYFKKYYIDISETHSASKVDSPSGTSIALLNAVLSVCPSLKPIYSCQGERVKDQISVISKRTGDTVGEHEITFAGGGEILTVKHQVFDRKVFALGALECAKFIKNKPSGLYKMEDIFPKEKCENCTCNKQKASPEVEK